MGVVPWLANARCFDACSEDIVGPLDADDASAAGYGTDNIVANTAGKPPGTLPRSMRRVNQRHPEREGIGHSSALSST